jgi:hypothetical protein
MGELKKAGQIWKEFEDYLAPLMGMRPGERALLRGKHGLKKAA